MAPEKFWVPERVREVLKEVSSFEDYKKKRVFRYLHLFSGPVDVLGRELKEEAKRNGMQVMILALDKKKDKDLDLAKPESQELIQKEVIDGMWDGTHSGFPCGSFSRARHNKEGDGPPPVRDAKNIYGLKNNSRKAQEEADRGTMMAVHSGWLHEEQVKSARRRGVPAVSTLENPPGDEVAGSAWMLPEIEKSLANTGSTEVQFNTCAFQRREKERWYKPGQWAGKLEGMERLNRKCNCPSWASHTSLKGKKLTEAAGEYPQELAGEVAKMIIMTWKRVLGLEYWRHKVETCAEEVGQYSKIWLEAERNRKSPPSKREEKAEGKRVASVAFEGDDNTENVRPKSSALPSKKERKIKDDDRLHLVKGCGMQIRNEWELFYLQNPQAKLVAKDYGTKEAVMDEEVLTAW